MKLTRREKSLLALVIREIQDSLADKKLKSRTDLAKDIKEKLDAWVRANDLHPESAEVMTVREFRRWLRRIEREETGSNRKLEAHRSRP